MTRLHLVDHNRPRRLSGAEIQALTAERVAARRAYNEQASERHKAEQAAWRRADGRRRDINFVVFMAAYLALLAGCCYLLWPRS